MCECGWQARECNVCIDCVKCVEQVKIEGSSTVGVEDLYARGWRKPGSGLIGVNHGAKG